MLRDTEISLERRMLEVIEQSIVPLTRLGVARGNKVFGAAILRKSDLSLVIAGSNEEVANPLWHGEIATLNAYYAGGGNKEVAPKDCYFLSTHEPCSLCLSAITWAGFDNFYYLFGYEQTRDAFNIPHDLKILKEVFGIEDGRYHRANQFWQCHSLGELIQNSDPADRPELMQHSARITTIYDDLSAAYQAAKDESVIPLA